jgi:hypothetical protein
MSEVTYRTIVEHPYREVAIEKRLPLDSTAESTVTSKPAFASPPSGAKPYHGFPLILSTRCDGYCFGAVTDYLDADTDDGCTIGDGFVEAPDGSRAGLIWSVEQEARFGRLIAPDDSRWGSISSRSSVP